MRVSDFWATMQQTFRTITGAASAAAPFRPQLAFSFDAERRRVDAWVRATGLWRTSLYGFLRRQGDLRLSVDDERLTFTPIGDVGFTVVLARDGETWRLDAGCVTMRFDQAQLAAGMFCAAVSGDARIEISACGDGMVEARLQLRHGADDWADAAVTPLFSAAPAARRLVNPGR